MSGKIYNFLKEDFLFEMNFVANIGTKLFVCPFLGRSKVSLICYYFTCALVLFTCAQLVVTLCLTRFKDLFEVINIAPNLGVCAMILLKYSKIHTHRIIYDEISNHFQNDLWEVVSDSTDHRRILDKYTTTSRRIVRFIYYYTMVLVAIVNLFPRIIMLYETNILGNEILYLYPFDGWYPFDKVKWFYAVYAWEGFMTAVVLFIYVFVNMIHISFTRYICMELKVLGNRMENLIVDEDVKNIIKRTHVQKAHDKVKGQLKLIIKRHQFLAKITSDLDQVLGDGMLLTYVFGSVFICLTIFTATVVDNNYLCLRYFSFFCSLLVEVFVQCIMGQLLFDHCEKFELSIYSADWPNTDTETKKMITILLIRAQRPFKFCAKGYITMNLDTFSGICSMSYQLFNLLRTSYA